FIELEDAWIETDNPEKSKELCMRFGDKIPYKALQVAKDLEDESIFVTVLNMSTIKPLDKKAIIELAKENSAIVTVEEHQIAGGMGSAVAEVLAENNPVPIEYVGVRDLFGQSGTPDELIEHYGMGTKHIKEAVQKVLKRKNLG
ncbi:MAG: hypothetical protein O3A55_05730, partial [Bacteroidetes bacterium]|nr:hypothetical protein [Bacteroidota bacterium]